MIQSTLELPDFAKCAISPKQLRQLVLENGAVMLRGAIKQKLLERILRSLEKICEHYSNVPESEFEERLKSQDIKERTFWQQIQLGHVTRHDFKKFAGYSYFEALKQSGLWKLTEKAWPEMKVRESSACHSRRMKPLSNQQNLWDVPVDFHVDAQFHQDHKFTINFWTPLTPCGQTSPGLQVILLGMDATKKYLEYNPEGYPPEPGDALYMNKFRTKKMQSTILKENGLLNYLWAPSFNVGDVLVFNNYAMHASYITPSMTEARTSVELRLDLIQKEKSFLSKLFS
jgi:Phytanoyl-CoA dioxygenase (PhyH)